MYKLIGAITLLQREIAEYKELFESATLDGYDIDIIIKRIDDFSDMLCDYNNRILDSYPEE
ncbi:hypothetical protein [Syntrophomonas wolfei]|jgi:hypothetical protein|uniref:hypothetical protein n=1 Tax=Syntrophomonas wolfei TaxID=863 RepID=UPI0023F38CFF|nr:hypothetical protein [Syntrophomonas wolfei]